MMKVEFASTKNGVQGTKNVAEVQYVYTRGRRRIVKTAKGVRSASTKDRDQSAKTVAEVQYVYTKDGDQSAKNASLRVISHTLLRIE